MGHGLGESAVDAEALGEAAGKGARVVVSLEDKGLEDVILGRALQAAVDHGHLEVLLLRDGGSCARGHHAHQRAVTSDGRAVGVHGGNTERLGLEVCRNVHGVEHEVGPGVGLWREERRAVLCDKLPVDEGVRHAEVLEVLEDHEVGALARRHGAQVARHAKAVGHVDRDHLDCRDGIYPIAHGLA